MNRIQVYRWIAAMAVTLLVGATGCDDVGRKSASLDDASQPDAAARVKVLSRLIRGGPPSTIVDARYFEVKTSGGVWPPAPSESQLFARITIRPNQMPAWTARTTALDRPANKPTVPAAVTWWMTPEDALGAAYYEPKSVFGRANGFIAVSPDHRSLFVWTSSM